MNKNIIFRLYEAYGYNHFVDWLKKAGLDAEHVLEQIKKIDPTFIKKGKMFYFPSLVTWVINGSLDIDNDVQVQKIKDLLGKWNSIVYSFGDDAIGKFHNWEDFFNKFRTLQEFERFFSRYLKSNGEVARDKFDKAGCKFIEQVGDYKYYYADDHRVMEHLSSSLERFCIKDRCPFYEEYGGRFIFVVKKQAFAGDFAIKHFSFWSPENREIPLDEMQPFQLKAVELGVKLKPELFPGVPASKKRDFTKIYVSLGLPVQSMLMKKIINQDVELKKLYSEKYGDSVG